MDAVKCDDMHQGLCPGSSQTRTVVSSCIGLFTSVCLSRVRRVNIFLEWECHIGINRIYALSTRSTQVYVAELRHLEGLCWHRCLDSNIYGVTKYTYCCPMFVDSKQFLFESKQTLIAGCPRYLVPVKAQHIKHHVLEQGYSSQVHKAERSEKPTESIQAK